MINHKLRDTIKKAGTTYSTAKNLSNEMKTLQISTKEKIMVITAYLAKIQDLKEWIAKMG